MPVPFKPVRASFGKDVVVQEASVIEHTESGLLVRPEQVYASVNENEDHLTLAFTIPIQHTSLIRTGAVNTINKAREFIHLAQTHYSALAAQYQKLDRQPRIVCSQLDDPLLDWEKIRTQHVFLAAAAREAKLDFNVVHMALPTERIFERIDIAPRTTHQKKNVDKLARELNWCGWVQYAFWISEEMEVLLQKFGVDASTTYQIEALCRDFIHEARSVLLVKSLKDLQDLSLQYADMLIKRAAYSKETGRPADVNQLNQKILEMEKDLFRASMPLKNSLHRILEIVLKIEAEAVRKDRIREEYIPIRRMVLLYRKILQSQIEPAETPQQARTAWAQQAMLRVLLDDELMVVSAVNSLHGVEKCHLTYSTYVATLELKHKFPPDRVIDMAFNWMTATPKLNKMTVELGFDGYRSWLKEQNVPDEQANLHRRAHVTDKLRKIYFRVLMDLCLPIQQLCSASPKSEEEGKFRASSSYLNLLPSFLEMKYDDDDVESIPYVEYDRESGEAKDLTDPGYRTLSRFRF